MLQIKVKKCWKVSKKSPKYLINMFSVFWHFAFECCIFRLFIDLRTFVEIYALFPQIFCNWKADSANFFAFRMYGDHGRLLEDTMVPRDNMKTFHSKNFSPKFFLSWTKKRWVYVYILYFNLLVSIGRAAPCAVWRNCTVNITAFVMWSFKVDL